MDVLMGTVPKVSSWASGYLTAIRKALWRIGFVSLSNIIGKIVSQIQSLFEFIISKLRISNRSKKLASEAIELVFCLFSTGGIVALFLDYITDGEVNRYIKVCG